jgi:hypothetical protein
MIKLPSAHPRQKKALCYRGHRRFHNAEELQALLLQAGPATAMTAERKARIYGTLKRFS